MKFGFFTMPEHPPIENWTLSYDRDIAAVVEAERLGFHEFWIGEHHTGGFENVPVPEFMIAKASALTHTIRLGTGVVNLPYQDPFMVAERLAFLDHLTHGRLDYGFGGGGLPTDKALFGLEPSEAAPRTNEALEIIWQLLTSEDPVSYEGVYWKYEGRQLQVGPYQDVPPFAIAGLTGTHNYAKCGERGWKPLSVHFAPIDNGTYSLAPDLKAMGAAMLEAGRRSGIPEATTRENWRIVREVYVTDDRNQAMNDIREGVKRSYDYLKGLGLGALMKKDETMGDESLTFEWMAENIPWIIGSPEECTRQLQELDEEVGGFGTLLINCRDWVTTDKWNRSLEMFARYVMPNFQANQRMARRQKMANVALGIA